jgi:hypothetical protein
MSRRNSAKSNHVSRFPELTKGVCVRGSRFIFTPPIITHLREKYGRYVRYVCYVR